MQNVAPSFEFLNSVNSTSPKPNYENEKKQISGNNIIFLKNNNYLVSKRTNTQSGLFNFASKDYRDKKIYLEYIEDQTIQIVTIDLNEYFKSKGIDIVNNKKYNEVTVMVEEGGISMYKTIYNGILILEKIGILMGILSSIFIFSLPLYSSLNWYLGTVGALPSLLISIFLYKIVREDE